MYESREPYADLEYADAYILDNMLDASDWLDYPDTKRLMFLKNASDQIDRLPLKGTGVGFPREPYGMPDDVIRATCELAFAFCLGIEVEKEYESYFKLEQKFASVSIKNRANDVPIHKLLGIPCAKAWQLLQPYVQMDGWVKA